MWMPAVQKAHPYDCQISRQVVDCARLNLSVLGFSFVFHDKAKRTQQGNLLAGKRPIPMITRFGNRLVAPPHPGSSANSANWITFEFLPSAVTRSIFFLFHLTSFPGVIYPVRRNDSEIPYNGQLWWGWGCMCLTKRFRWSSCIKKEQVCYKFAFL